MTDAMTEPDGRQIWRPTTAEIDLGAVSDNVAAICNLVAPSGVCAVVKANGYGHGAVETAWAAIRGGASWLAVALVEEAVELRASGIEVPILVLSEFPASAAAAVVAHRLTATVYSHDRLDLLDAVAGAAGAIVDVHLKVDTGMHRVGCDPHDAVALASAAGSKGNLRHTGTFTHLATADEPAKPYTRTQLDRFEGVLMKLRTAGVDPGVVHAANSAGAIAHPRARYDMVRVGVAIYGNDPDAELRTSTFGLRLKPVLTFRSEVSFVKVLGAGARVSYGLIHGLTAETIVATVPVGYADGVPRRLSSVGGEVLIGGRRRPMLGRVTMDQLLVDCGPADGRRSAGPPVVAGDEVVLLGHQADHAITPWEWAVKLDTIAYEITCSLSARVPKRYVYGPYPDGPVTNGVSHDGRR